MIEKTSTECEETGSDDPKYPQFIHKRMKIIHRIHWKLSTNRRMLSTEREECACRNRGIHWQYCL